MRITAQVWRAAKARYAPARHRRRIAFPVDLQCRTDEEIGGIVPGQLAVHAIRAQAAVASREKNVGSRGNVLFHPIFIAEAVHALNPSALDGWNQRRLRIENPVTADLAFEAELLSICGQQ